MESFRHLTKILSFFPDEIFPNEVFKYENFLKYLREITMV